MLYLCLPAYNEGPTVGLVLWSIHKVFSSYSREYELLVVDDASDDATAETLETYARLLPLTVIRHQTRRGYAAALDTLARAAAGRTRYPRRDAAIFMQADFSDPPEALPDLVKRFEGGADLVVAEPDRQPETGSAGIRWVRHFAPRLLRPMLRLQDVADPLGSYRLARITVLRDALRACGEGPLVHGSGWAANVELTVRLARFSRRIESVTVSPRYELRPRATRVRPLSGALELYRSGRALQPRRETTI
jgi:glycosyltransferase involved in cell wall biosynthesis